MTKSQQEELELIIAKGKFSFSLERGLKSLIAEIENDAQAEGYMWGQQEANVPS